MPKPGRLRNALLVADLHLNVKIRDAYRWKIWDVLRGLIERDGDIYDLFILGDLTADKDFHSAHLVNGIVGNLSDLVIMLRDNAHNNRPPTSNSITIIRGNHDGIDPNEPFFLFLNFVDGVVYNTGPTLHEYGDYSALTLPHFYSIDELNRMNQEAFDAARRKGCDVVLAHFTVEGSIPGKGGISLKELNKRYLNGLATFNGVYSGDVHTPGIFGNVEYVGAPYHMNFGDRYDPQVLLFDNDGEKHSISLADKFPRRVSIKVDLSGKIGESEIFTIVDRATAGILKDDMVKVEVNLSLPLLEHWRTIKDDVNNSLNNVGAVVNSVEFTAAVPASEIMTPSEISLPPADQQTTVAWLARNAFRRYCKEKGLSPETIKIGMELFDGAED